MPPATEPLTARAITAQLLVQIPERFPQARVWRVNVAASVNAQTGQVFRSGLRGMADISGIGPGGVRIEIEVKAGRDKMRPEQEAWRAMILRHGGIHIIARDVDQALDELAAEIARREQERGA